MKNLGDLKEIAFKLPQKPGVYIMKNTKGKIIYVGKAKNLRKRVSSYFTRNKDLKTTILVKKIDNIESIITNNEYDALVLENTLIKEHSPRYNIALKDGKTYPVIRITNEEYPRVFKTRSIIRDGSDYYGPYPQSALISVYIEFFHLVHPLRYCKGKLKKRKQPCLYYHIGKCSGPCIGKISKESYQKRVEDIRLLLQEDIDIFLNHIHEQMKAASENLFFEKAAKFRDLIQRIHDVQATQTVQDFDDEQRDYICCAVIENLASFAVFKMREGKLIGRDLYRTEIYDDLNAAYTQFIVQYYDQDIDIPMSIPTQLFINDLIDILPLENFFARQGKTIHIHIPEAGQDYTLLRMAYENAIQDVRRRAKAIENLPALQELQAIFKLESLPNRIEGFDIAQLHGKYPVSSMVTFYNGVPDKKNYRYFSIKSLNGAIDDYESLREAVARRYTRLLNEHKTLPDLVLIDGGKGQVNAVHDILTALGLEIPVIGLAKKEEEVFLPHQSQPMLLDQRTDALKLLQHVRDEAHRFATNFNKKKRSDDIRFTQLEAIDGIGPKRSRELMTLYGSISGIVNAGAEDLSAKTKIPLDLAEKLIQTLENS